ARRNLAQELLELRLRTGRVAAVVPRAGGEVARVERHRAAGARQLRGGAAEIALGLRRLTPRVRQAPAAVVDQRGGDLVTMRAVGGIDLRDGIAQQRLTERAADRARDRQQTRRFRFVAA